MLMLMAVMTFSTAFSQNKYPKKLVIDGDTITLISQPQVKKINLAFFDLHVCDSNLILKEMAINTMAEKTNFMQHQIDLYGTIALNDSLIQRKLKADNLFLTNENEKQKGIIKRKTTSLYASVAANVLLGIATVISIIFAVK
jgi:hypothetical protein